MLNIERVPRRMLIKEVVCFLCFAGILLGIVVTLASNLPIRTSTPIDQPLPGVRFDSFGVVEQVNGLAVRRVQPDANIQVPAGGPAVFDIGLVFQGGEGTYPLRVTINGVPSETLQITGGVHEYRVRYLLTPAVWGPNQRNSLRIALSPGLPNADTGQATLPVALAHIEVQPMLVLSPIRATLLLPNLLLLLILYLALRFIFPKHFLRIVGIFSVALLVFGVGALALPATTLYFAQQPGLYLRRTGGVLILVPAITAAILFVRHSGRTFPLSSAFSGLGQGEAVQVPVTRTVLARDLTAVFMVALGIRLLWALLVPPWQAPDEGAHFSYVAHIVESAELPGIGTPKYGNSPGYSVEFNNSWNNTLFNRISSVGLPRTPELAFLPPNYDYEIARDYQAPAEERQNVAGGTATPYPPLYYLIIAVPYKLFQNEPIISRLFASRIVSAMFGALGCSFAYLMAYEIRRERLWGFSLGLCMVLLPMYAFIGSSINNDTAMICGTTALIWAAARAFRQQQMSPRLLWSMGVISGCILLVKPTGAVVVVLVGLAMLVRQWPILRYPWRIRWSRIRAIARFTLPIIGMYSSLIFLRILLDRTSTGTSSVAGMDIGFVPTYSFRSYMQSEFNAGSPYFFWLFIKSFWGIFGWLEVTMPDWSYSAVLVFCCIGLVGSVLNFFVRRQERRLSLLLLGPIIGQLAFLFIIADYVLSYAKLGIGLGLQGRYLFPVLAPILFLLISGWYALSGRREFVLYLAPLGMLLLQITALITIITRYYGITFGW